MLETELVASATKSSRLMVVLHGLGDSAAGFRWLPEALGLPWMNYLLVNAPDPYFGGYSWYDFAGEMGPGILRSRELLFELLDTQPKAGFPTAETVILGFSQGCLMAIEAGCRYPRVFNGVVGISGYAFEPERMVKELSPVALKQRFMITHGFQDPIVPFAATREQIKLLKAAGLNISWHEFVKAHTIAGESELSVIRDFITADRRTAGRA